MQVKFSRRFVVRSVSLPVLAIAAFGLAMTPSGARAACATGTGNITVSTVETDCILDNGDSLTVTGTGNISAATSPAVSLNTAATPVNITNNGIITSNNGNAAIDLSGGQLAGNLTNNNGISATGGAYAIIIGNNSGGIQGALTNNSNIITTSGGIYGLSTNLTGGIVNAAGAFITGDNLSAIELSAVTGGDIRNSGDISADTGNTIQIYNGSDLGTLYNEGNIRSNGAAVVDINDSLIDGFENTADGDINGNNNAFYGVVVNNTTVEGSFINGGTIRNVGTAAVFLADATIDADFLNSGNIQGQQSGLHLNNTTVSGDFINQLGGSISGGTGLGNVGLRAQGTITLSGLQNFGYIGGEYALNMNQTLLNGYIYNGSTGTIQGTQRGVYLYDFDHASGEINNYGTIDGGAFGVYADGTAAPGLHTTTINNYDTISGPTAAVYSSADAPEMVLNNYRMLDGDVTIENGTLNLRGINGRITGTTNVENLNVIGTFTAEGTILSNALTINSGGRLNNGSQTFIMGGGTGTMTNNGTFALAEGTTSTVNGSYAQSAGGILRTAIANNTTAVGRVGVSGDAVFAAGSRIFVDVNATNTLAVGQTISNVLVVSGMSSTLTASTFNVTDNSAMFRFTTSLTTNGINLNVLRGLTAVESVDENRNNGGRGAAAVLDDIVDNNTAGFTDVVNNFGALATTKEISDKVTETLPVVAGNANLSAVYGVNSVVNVVTGRQSSGAAGGAGFISNGNVWFKPFGSWSQHASQGGVAGFSSGTAGAVIGVDGDVSDDRKIGVALSYGRSNVRGRDAAANGHLGADNYHVNVYGSQNVCAGTEATFVAGVGVNDNSSKRFISLTNQTARADFTGYTFNAGAGLNHTVALDPDTTFTPGVRVDYLAARSNSYSETGAGVLNLNVDRQTVDQMIPAVEAKVTRKVSPQAKLTANAGVGYDVLAERGQVVSSFAGGGGNFTTTGLDPSPWIMRGGVGLDIMALDDAGMDLTARYDIEKRGTDFANQTVSLRVSVPF